MQTLGLSDSTPRTESRLKSLFWPTIKNQWDLDYVTNQGFWICVLVGSITFVVGLFTPGQDLQERRLAVAVAPDHADPLTTAYAETDRVEQCAGPEALRNSFQIDQVRCRHNAPKGS